MEAIIFIGLPGSGKSSFYKERFFSTHVRVSRDLLKTRHRQQRLLELCLETDQRFVIDNTNATRRERSEHIEGAKSRRFAVVGYYFESKVDDCLRRNANRSGLDRVPDVAIYAAAKKLELPSLDEGYDRLFYVRTRDGWFECEDWNNEI